MTAVRRLSLEQARRIAIRAQMLDADRPTDMLTMVDRLTFLQLDPTAVVAPAADLVSWSRLGNAFDPAELRTALEADHTLFEHRAQESEKEPIIVMLRPTATLALYLADMEAARHTGSSRRLDWLAVNDGFRRRVLELLRTSGPLASRDIPDSAESTWESTGWTNDRNVTQMLEFLASHGEVAVGGRQGRQRLWDLAERVYPTDIVVVPADEARAIRDQRRLRSLGVARSKVVGQAGVAAEIEGTPGLWRLDPDATADGFEGRTALLSPFDRLIHDRARAVDLFAFEYTLEMYKPAAKRRWGYFALPILHDDRLVGKVDVAADNKASRLVVHALHPDVRFTKAITAAVDSELRQLATWLGLERVTRD